MVDHSNAIALGFDFGMKRIGVAVGQAITQTATPLIVLKAADGKPNWSTIEALIKDWRPTILLIGLPYNIDGSEQPITLAAKKFARRLETKFKLLTLMVDERLTTIEAKAQMKQLNPRDDLSQVDSYAAKLIVESWLFEQQRN